MLMERPSHTLSLQRHAFCLSAGQTRGEVSIGGYWEKWGGTVVVEGGRGEKTDLYLIELTMMRLQNNLNCQAHYHPVLH